MNCDYFGICGSCSIFGITYEDHLKQKIKPLSDQFKSFYSGEFEIFESLDERFRSRAEFKIFHHNGKISYAMNTTDKSFVTIVDCKIVNDQISKTMRDLLPLLQCSDILSNKLFGIEFLSGFDEVLVTLIYHKKLDEIWIDEAKKLANSKLKIIGRSRGVKLILGEDFVTSQLLVNNKIFKIIHKEGAFSQPNSKINSKMVSWVVANLKDSKKDLCELYCGGGNFTLPLSQKFRKVLATEISKSSIASARQSCLLSNVSNITFVRMSAEEFTSALAKTRDFVRLRDIDLESFDFETIFVDPPRAGIDESTLKFVSTFEFVVYISCNPQTLLRDLETLCLTHEVQKFAFFDQFSWTHHVECGVILKRNCS